ncbi:Transcriptional regulator (Cro/CI family protein) [uncultured Desulfatiglans sp.]|nr:Transcriptional regulator (Cro/CI family protein) [uncultured Desulfatiglans sp.]
MCDDMEETRMQEEWITQNIRNLREKKGMTLQELADLTGLTKSYLSKIERSKKAPPYSTVNKIANALGVDVRFIFEGNGEEDIDPRITFTRRGAGEVVETVGAFYGYKYEALASKKPGKNMLPYIIEPAFEEKGVFQHEGEELLYVLEGRHEFVYDGKSTMMEEGDCVYFDAGVPHYGRSVGEKKAKLLAVMFNYKRL